MTSPADPDYLARNRAAWTGYAAEFAVAGRRLWGSEPQWGIWGIPDSEVGLLPKDLAGIRTLELGCGTGYVSAWLARRGAHPVGLDITPAQLANARQYQREFGLVYPLVEGPAEAIPLRDECVDFVVSEYGAAIWSDPYRWIPEAARVLRPGGRLLFLGNSTLLVLCMFEDNVPADPVLKRPLFGLHRLEWPTEDAVDFCLSHGAWIRLLRSHGFVIEDLVELQAPQGATTSFQYVDSKWASQWPSEEAWKARKA